MQVSVDKKIMISRAISILVLALLTWSCFGATPVATISSTQPVVVSGITIPTNRVMSWPVAVNDEIATQTAPAVLRFTDGTIVTLQRDSRMRLEAGPTGVEVKMLSGSASYALKARSTVSFGPKITGLGIPTNIPSSAPSRPASQNEETATALIYRMPAQAPGSGVVFAPSMISTAAFAPTIAHQVTPPPQSVIILPSGLAIFVTPITAQGVTTGYTIVGVGAVTSNGIIQTPGVTALNGYTIAVQNGSVNTDQIKIFAPGSPSPVPDNQAGTLIQNTVKTVNQSLPSGQQISTTPGITIQPFSASAP
jgi:hypothetical protein